jgi:hypothetical protein
LNGRFIILTFLIDFFYHGATAPPHWAKAPSLPRIHDHAYLNTPQSVGLLCTSVQSDEVTST